MSWQRNRARKRRLRSLLLARTDIIQRLFVLSRNGTALVRRARVRDLSQSETLLAALRAQTLKIAGAAMKSRNEVIEARSRAGRDVLLCLLLASVQKTRIVVVSGGSHSSTEKVVFVQSLWKENIDTEENYEHSVVKEANIITEPAVR